MKLRLQSHGFFVTPNGDRERRLLESFAMTLAQMETSTNPRTGETVTEVKSIFAAWKEDRSEFGFMRECLSDFRSHLDFSGFPLKELEEEIVPIHPGIDILGDMKEEFKPREKQLPAVNFLSESDRLNRVIDAATGFGKSFLGLNTSLSIKKRTAFLMEPGHIKTWLMSIPQQTNLSTKDICVIQGSQSLRALMLLQQGGQNDYKLIFISAPTFREYIKSYESLDGFDYDVPPQELFEYLGIGTLIRDEVHEAIHQVVKQTIYINVARIVFLSATLVSDNQFINRIYEKIFPLADRWKSEDNKHISCRSVLYDMYDPKGKIKYMGFKGYSHVKYEQSIMKNKKVLEQYLSFISSMLYNSYVKTYQDGIKALMIFSTKEMCRLVTERIKRDYPQYTVGCYIHGAKDEELYERDVVISTPRGAGTGVDIPNLAVGWLTVGLSSTQLGRQIMGRLRSIAKYKDRAPLFLWLSNKQINSHKTYDTKRKNDVKFRSKDIRVVDTHFILKAA